MIQNHYWQLQADNPDKTLQLLEPGKETIKRLKPKVLEIDAATSDDGITVHLRIKSVTRTDIMALSRKVITAVARRCHVRLDKVTLTAVETEPSARNLTKETGRTPMRSSAA